MKLVGALIGEHIKLHRNQPGFIIADGMIALTICMVSFGWFATNQGQLTRQLRDKERVVEKIRLEKEASDQAIEAFYEKTKRV